MTVFVLLLAGYTGYAYARLKHDEVLRRKMYAHYANFMWVFGICTEVYEHLYDKWVNAVTSFDSSELFWR
jgi:hypothetical protein